MTAQLPVKSYEDKIVNGRIDNDRIEYMLVGVIRNRAPDLIRLQPEGGWRPSIYRKPGESDGQFWNRVVAAAIELRNEKVYKPTRWGIPMLDKLPMFCHYGVSYVDEETAFRSDLMDAMKAGLRSAMNNPGATPQARLQAISMMAKLLWPELKGR